MEARLTVRDRESCPQGRSPRRRVLIVDNSADLARALVGVIDLEDDLEAVGYVSTAAEALDMAHHSRADVMVLDLGLTDCSGFAVLDRLRREHPDIRVIIYSGHPTTELGEQAISRGAVGCVRKGDDLGHLLAAIRAA